MAAPISSAVAARSNGSGLNRSRQFSALPVRSCAFFRISLARRSVATGPGLTGHHADAVAHAHTAERLGEDRERRIAGEPADIVWIMRLRRVADDVDDDPGLARFHQRVERPAHV